jgi:hypothetical protein
MFPRLEWLLPSVFPEATSLEESGLMIGRSRAPMVVVLLLWAGCAWSGGATTSEAPPTTEHVSPLLVGAWGGMEVATVCLWGHERYEEISGVSTPVQDGLAAAFDQDVTVTVVEAGCDATIRIELTGTPLSAYYVGGVGGTLYTGAEVSGTLTLSTEGQLPLVGAVSERAEPPEDYFSVKGSALPREPKDAPIWGAANSDVCAMFAEWFDGSGRSADLPRLLANILGHWPPRDEECGEYGEQAPPFLEHGN